MSMRKYNVCKAFGFIIEDFKIPYGSIFGRDNYGLYVFTRPSYINKQGELPVYRLYPSEGWQCNIESTPTTWHIIDHYQTLCLSMRSGFRDPRTTLAKKMLQADQQIHQIAMCCKRKEPQKYNTRGQFGYMVNPFIGIESDKPSQIDLFLMAHKKVPNNLKREK